MNVKYSVFISNVASCNDRYCAAYGREFSIEEMFHYFVRKGEKALLLWGHPKPSKQALTTANENGKTEEDAENDFYPIAYVFSNMQVKQISK